ncbi:HNH endonuclease [Bacillus cereus]|nr:HNH endonuclease [Bacillus cereus]
MTKVISVTRKNGDSYDVIVDDDFESHTNVLYKSGSYGKHYFSLWRDGKHKRLHRVILGIDDPDIVVDHINGDTLDNRKCNLRACSHLENQKNAIRKGYTYRKRINKFQVRIFFDGKERSFGFYDTEQEASEVYKREHAKLFGEFSPYFKGENK